MSQQDVDVKLYTIQSPPPAQWRWSIEPNFWVAFYLPTAPNRFHRWMQRWLLGIHWERV